MIIVAIDPGANGAITILNTYRFRETYAIPLAPNTLTDIYLFLSEIRGGEVYRRAQHIVDISKNDISSEYSDISIPSRTSIKKVLPTLPYVMKPEEAEDNTMEFWLEEPGQIVVNRLTTKGDSTSALLAGMTASRKLGRSIGQWEGIAAALNISVNLIPPKKWQSAIGSKAKGNKNILKKDAECIFNHLTGENGKSRITLEIADSLLIAAYAYMQYAEQKYWPSSLKNLLKANGTI